MSKTSLLKNTTREFLRSKARFLSILGIIFLGVTFYAGIKATGPDMLKTATHYYEQHGLMDLKVVSDLGINQDDIAWLKKKDTIKQVMPVYSQDINLIEKNKVVKLYSYQAKTEKQLNRLVLTKGRLPKKNNEVVLDSRMLEAKEYQIGDRFKLKTNKDLADILKRTDYKIVGFVNSPLYIEHISRGNTQVGKGSLDFFAYVPEDNFKLPVYTEAYIQLKQPGLAYSKEYETSVKQAKKQLLSDSQKQGEQRVNSFFKQLDKETTQAKQDLAVGNKKIKEAQEKLQQGQEKLAKGKEEYQQGLQQFQTEIQAGKEQLAAKENQLAQSEQDIKTKEQQLATSQQQLDQLRAQLGTSTINLAQNLAGLSQSIQLLTAQQLAFTKQLQQLTLIQEGIKTTTQQVSVGEVIPREVLETWIVGLDNPVVDYSSQQNFLRNLIEQPVTSEELTQIKVLGVELSQGKPIIQQNVTNISQQLAEKQTAYQGLKTYQEQSQALERFRQGLLAGKTQLARGKQAIKEGKDKLNDKEKEGEAKLAASKEQLATSEAELKEGQSKLAKETEALATGKKKLATALKEKEKITSPTYYIFTRDDLPGYSEFKENANRISSIATIFPVFFFMIAALVSLTTMTRMVDEKRSEIGTLKALGYTNREISQKYVVYAAVAAIVGTVLGLGVGFYVFPTVIFDAYRTMYNLPKALIHLYPSYSIQSLVVALLCTIGASLIVLRVDLVSVPAKLMRPKAPKIGKRILLERVPFIWNRFNFNQKITARNLFRYKQRMLMTVFGIAGCMALLVTGFGLKDSIVDIVDLQFGKIWTYDSLVIQKEGITKKDQEKYLEKLEQLPNYQDHLNIARETYQVKKSGQTTQEVTIEVPKDTEKLSQFIQFKDRQTQKKQPLTENGVLITEKLGKLFQVKVGETITVRDKQDTSYQLKVSGIVENYAMHFIYMTPSYYQKIFQHAPVYNGDLITFDKTLSKGKENQLAESLMKEPTVVNVSFVSEMSEAMEETIKSLNIVMTVLIISAALLAFIVLYNLTNINISERIRELSTIKVLGFYNLEVTRYIYRENDLLTLLGILVGCLVGKWLHYFVLQTSEVDMMMFSPVIHLTSYLYAGLLSLLFSLLVMLVMHQRLRKIDMIEALKSVD